jgi:ribosome modulation factor
MGTVTEQAGAKRKWVRPLGDFTDMAWLAGWDAGITGASVSANPYKRPAQRRAWEKGRACGLRSDDSAVAAMKRRVGRR